MVNPKKTQEQIFEVARRIFRRKGYAGTRMQEIADEAGISKSMLHYYYRTKEKLFNKVLLTEVGLSIPIIYGILDSKDPLDEKVRQLIDASYSLLQDNPYIGHFIFIEMNQHPGQFRSFISEMGIQPLDSFFKEIQEKISLNGKSTIKAEQFMVNVIGLILFPFLAQTTIKSLFDMDGTEYLKFLNERKEFLAEFILNGIKYQNQ